jgi:hypothetical protein
MKNFCLLIYFIFFKSFSFVNISNEKAINSHENNSTRKQIEIKLDKIVLYYTIEFGIDSNSFIKNDSTFHINIIEFKSLNDSNIIPISLTKRLKENFEQFYRVNPDKLKSQIITNKDISYFIRIQDYNFDGINDFGLSIQPSGHNVCEDIWITLNNKLVYWYELSGKPIWEIDKNNRVILTGWSRNSFEYSTQKYKVTNDTVLFCVRKESSLAINDSMKIVRLNELINNEWIEKSDTLKYSE